VSDDWELHRLLVVEKRHSVTNLCDTKIVVAAVLKTGSAVTSLDKNDAQTVEGCQKSGARLLPLLETVQFLQQLAGVVKF
jgi:hypothetical protein